MKEARPTDPQDVDGHFAGTESTATNQDFAGPLADAALALLAAFFRDPKELATFLTDRVAAVPRASYLGVERGHYQDVSEVLRLWETRAEFLDAAGKPRLLPMAGKGSFSQLSRQAYPELLPETVLAALESGSAVERAGGQVRLLSRTKLVRSMDQAAHGRAALVGTRLLRSLVGNLDPHGNSDKLFERTVLGHDIPRAQLPALKAFMLRHGQQYLEDFDDWLETLQAPEGPDNVSAGACLFLFTDPPRTRK